MLNLAVFVSGSGSNLQSIIDAVSVGEIVARIALVVGSKADIYALERAKKADIPTVVFDKKQFSSDNLMFDMLLLELKKHQIDLIVLAGYLSILPKKFVESYVKRIINIHPSLIPKYCGKDFYGMKVHQAVIEGKEKFSGATVHFVDEGTDTGEIILQEKVAVKSDDTPQSLQQRVLGVEHQLLPKAINTVIKLLLEEQ